MTPEQIQDQKSKLIDDIMDYHSSPQTKLMAIDALWSLAKVEAIKEWEEEQKETHY